MADTDYSTEIWKIIPPSPDYAVSDHGRVKRVVARPKAPARILSGYIDHEGYRQVTLITEGTERHWRVHRLVAIAFIGAPPSPLHQVAHWDGCRDNNVPGNLRWATTQENSIDSIRHNSHKGERSGLARLTDAEVAEIRTMHRNGETFAKLGALFGVSGTHIARIVRYERRPDPI